MRRWWLWWSWSWLWDNLSIIDNLFEGPNAIFNLNGNVDASLLDDIKHALYNVGYTQQGYDVLEGLQMSGQTFSIDGSSGLPAYSANANEFVLGNLASTSNSYSAESMAHELYHAYQDINLVDTGSLNTEVDSFLYSQSVIRNSDPSWGYVPSGGDTGPGTDYAAFADAWDNISSGLYSDADYQTVLDSFGYYGPGVYENLDVLDVGYSSWLLEGVLQPF